MNYYSGTYSYSDTDLENLHVSLNNQWFSLIFIKVSQRAANDQIIDGKMSPKVRHFADNSGHFSDIMTSWIKLPKYQSLKLLGHVSSAKQTQEPPSTHF